MGAIDDEHVRAVCKIGQGHACCRYLTVGPEGWGCVKLDPQPIRSLLDVMDGRPATLTAKRIIDDRVACGEMMAHGDNCEGR